MSVRARVWAVLGALALSASACAGGDEGTVTVYTSVTQATVDAVVAGFEETNPDVAVEVFRAPTGEVAARIEAERRNGTLSADVIWLSDPLSMYQYQADGLLAEWQPAAAAALPPEAQTASFWGTRVLHLVIVTQAGNSTGVDAWPDLVDAGRAVAFPDPRFAGSAFAALGHFGLDFFRDLQASGAVQVSAPGEVVTGVAEGRYDAGLTLEFSARSAVEKGSPIEVVWPRPAAVAVTSPIAVFGAADPAADARGFVDHVLSAQGQTAIGATGWSPMLASVPGPPIPSDADIVYPDWAAIYAGQEALVAGYAALFDG
ncbi:MAG: extracellular solute-binding protein [Acidimicrobiia bacterium]|nr:extracellular solute-binding protein [Acidimicrobiia bacterium]